MKNVKEEKTAKFYDLEWVPGTNTLKQGVKGGRRPKNSYAGGNGSFIVGTPAELNLTVICGNGRFVTKNIYYDVKEYSDERITVTFRQMLEKKLLDEEFKVSGKEITNIYEIFNQIF